MSEKIKIITFADLMERSILEIGDGYRAKLEELGGDGPFFLRAGLLVKQGFDWASAERFRADVFPKVRSKLGQSGDTMVTTKGNSVGRTAYVPAGAPEFVYSPHLSYWRSADSSQLSSGFLRYWSRSPEFSAQLESMAHGTDMAPYLSLADQRRLRISLPPIFIQEAIAEVLGSLDDKIAVNDRIASTTNEVASAILEELLLCDSEASDVLLCDIANVNQRKAVPIAGGSLRYIDISSVSVGHVEWPELTSWDAAPGRARRVISSGDTIWSTVRPNRKSFALVLDDDPKLVASTGFAVLTPVKVGPAFLYEITKRDAFVQYLGSVAEGSAYPAVRAERFEQAVIPLPSPGRLETFETITMPLRQRSHAAEMESRTLADLRDILLPKLMSGEIRVLDAQRVVKEVT